MAHHGPFCHVLCSASIKVREANRGCGVLAIVCFPRERGAVLTVNIDSVERHGVRGSLVKR